MALVLVHLENHVVVVNILRSVGDGQGVFGLGLVPGLGRDEIRPYSNEIPRPSHSPNIDCCIRLFPPLTYGMHIVIIRCRQKPCVRVVMKRNQEGRMEYFDSMENILWLIWLGVGVAFILAELAVSGIHHHLFRRGGTHCRCNGLFRDHAPDAAHGLRPLLPRPDPPVQENHGLHLCRGPPPRTTKRRWTTPSARWSRWRKPSSRPHTRSSEVPGFVLERPAAKKPWSRARCVRIIKRNDNDPNTFMVEKEN